MAYQIGANIILDDNNNIINVSNINSSGISTASSFSGSGANLTSLNASNISSGTVATARLGSGSASSSTFLRGDGSWQTPAGGAWTYISSVTASNSASVAFTSGIDSTYDNYLITYNNLTLVNNIGFHARFSSDGGSSYLSSGYFYAENTFSAPQGAQFIRLNFYAGTSYPRLAGSIFLYEPANSSSRTALMHNGVYQLGSVGLTAGYHDTVQSTNAIQFYAASGNIASGTFRLYGLKKS